MSYEAMGKLMDRWMQDTDFRVAMRKNPKEAVRQSGVLLTDEEQETLMHIDWQLSDEALQMRVSKL